MHIIGGLIRLYFTLLAGGLSLVVIAAFYALTCIGLMQMFRKAGVEGWRAWVPFYRNYVLCEITMGCGWYFLFGFIVPLAPFVNALYAVEVTLSYGESVPVGILYFFFPFIMKYIIGFGDSSYVGPMNLNDQMAAAFGGRKKASAKTAKDEAQQGSASAPEEAEYADGQKADTAAGTAETGSCDAEHAENENAAEEAASAAESNGAAETEITAENEAAEE